MNKSNALKIFSGSCLLLLGLGISNNVISMSSGVKQSILMEAMNPTPPVIVVRKPAPQTYAIKIITAENLTGYFVSPNGSDGNSGSYKSPWKTIQAAINKLKPGDVLNVLNGTYVENVTPVVSGTFEQPIIIRAVNALAVTIDGGSGGLALNVADDSNLKFEGLKLKNASGSSGLSAAINTKTKAVPVCTTL
jgi:hypothetical protein